MLDMFKRKSDPKEYNYLYALPGTLGIGTMLAAHAAGVPNIYQCGYLFSSLCCIAGIAGLADQTTATLGASMGMTGIVGGISTALAALSFPPAVFA